jgi:hypothetical protein
LNELIELLRFVGVRNSVIEKYLISSNKFRSYIKPVYPKLNKESDSKLIGELKLVSEQYTTVVLNVVRADSETFNELYEFIKNNFVKFEYEQPTSSFWINLGYVTDLLSLKNLMEKFNIGFRNHNEHKKLVKAILFNKSANQDVYGLNFVIREIGAFSPDLMFEYLKKALTNGIKWDSNIFKTYSKGIAALPKYGKIEGNSIEFYLIKGIFELLMVNENIYPNVKFKIFEALLKSEDFEKYIKTYKMIPSEKFKGI